MVGVSCTVKYATQNKNQFRAYVGLDCMFDCFCELCVLQILYVYSACVSVQVGTSMHLQWHAFVNSSFSLALSWKACPRYPISGYPGANPRFL